MLGGTSTSHSRLNTERRARKESGRMEKKERKTGKEKIRRKIGLGVKERKTGVTKDIRTFRVF